MGNTMFKRFGYTKTDCVLSDKAFRYYSETDGCVIWQTGEDDYMLNENGAVMAHLTLHELNVELEERADYGNIDLT